MRKPHALANAFSRTVQLPVSMSVVEHDVVPVVFGDLGVSSGLVSAAGLQQISGTITLGRQR